VGDYALMAAKRSDLTKRRILEAARRRFAAEGFERSTIRAVAADAGIDAAMVMRYFGSKDALFAAAAAFDLHLPDLTAVPAGERGRRLAEHFLGVWGGPDAGGGLAILLRAAATNAEAAARMRAIFADQVLPMVAAVAPDAAAARAGLIASQILGMALCRSVLQLPPLTALDAPVLVASLGETLQRYLDGRLPPG
jgi:AcrR family transcriptional regulator